MTTTQQIEEAAEKAATDIINKRDDYLASHDAPYYGQPQLKADLLKFAAQLMQTGAMKEVESALIMHDARYTDIPDDLLEEEADQIGSPEARATWATRKALASISALKGLGDKS